MPVDAVSRVFADQHLILQSPLKVSYRPQSLMSESLEVKAIAAMKELVDRKSDADTAQLVLTIRNTMVSICLLIFDFILIEVGSAVMLGFLPYASKHAFHGIWGGYVYGRSPQTCGRSPVYGTSSPLV